MVSERRSLENGHLPPIQETEKQAKKQAPFSSDFPGGAVRTVDRGKQPEAVLFSRQLSWLLDLDDSAANRPTSDQLSINIIQN